MSGFSHKKLMVSLSAIGLMAASVGTQAQVKIAYIDPLSGPFANVGEGGLKQFREVAEIDINQKGGVNGQKI